MTKQWETLLEKFWAEQVQNFSLQPAHAYVQIRKLFTNYGITIPYEVFQTGISMPYSMMGYGNDTAKGKQLQRNYFNEPELRKAREKFKERLASRGKKNSQSCITARMGSEAKREDSQGFCMQTITINYVKDHVDGERLTIDLNYRTTELVQKFLADLKFLHEVVVPYLLEDIDIEPVAINCTFSTIYVSLMFFPILLRGIDILGFLKELEVSDPRYHKTVVSAMEKWMNEESNYTYRTRLMQHNFFRRQVADNLSATETKRINSYVKKFRG